MSKIDEKNIIEPGDIGSIPKLEFKVEEYIRHFKRLVELERRQEMERHEREMKRLSGKERERRGRAVLNARGRDQGTGLGGRYIVKFVRKRGLPETEISVGDLVMVSKNRPLAGDNPSGTVIERTNYSLTAVFDAHPPKWAYGRVRIDLYVNDITFQRMLDALGRIRDLTGDKRELVDRIMSKGGLNGERSSKRGMTFFNRDLNESQRIAVERAVGSPHLYLVHGPPGTGKTVTCIEIIEQEVEMGRKVLACSDSNTSVDNLLERLIGRGRKAVRVGHPARVTPVLRERTLDYVLEKNLRYTKAQELREKVYALKDEQERYTYPSGRWRRGLSNDAIKRLARKGRGSRGIPPEKIKEMARSLEYKDRIDSLFRRIDVLEQEAVDEILGGADIVCTTNSSSASEIMEGREFDTCVIDEATQAYEPSCIVPIIRAGKVIMAGDHKQLPPTILNREAKEEGLANTMFERLLAMYGEDVKTMLDVQYRMNERIMRFSSEEFYGGAIVPDPSVRDHTLAGLAEPDGEGGDGEGGDGDGSREVLAPDNVIVLLDTAGTMPEKTRGDSTSKENPGEAEMTGEIVSGLLRTGITPTDIGVITPYHDQKDLISSKIRDERIEIDTVDGFQGREKEAIVLSLTRSNPGNRLGFLKDLRRLNVSITRARRKLIIIADTTTVSVDPVYSRLFEYIEEIGLGKRIRR